MHNGKQLKSSPCKPAYMSLNKGDEASSTSGLFCQLERFHANCHTGTGKCNPLDLLPNFS